MVPKRTLDLQAREREVGVALRLMTAPHPRPPPSSPQAQSEPLKDEWVAALQLLVAFRKGPTLRSVAERAAMGDAVAQRQLVRQRAGFGKKKKKPPVQRGSLTGDIGFMGKLLSFRPGASAKEKPPKVY